MKIFIFTALYREAAPLIRHFRLKKTEVLKGTDSFGDGESILLTLTGSGMLNAAAVTSAVLSRCEVSEGDKLISWGSAAALSGKLPKTLYCLHKITERHGRRSYYPDMIIDTGLPEASAVCGNTVFREGEEICGEYDLYDMESAGVFHAGKMFFPPHGMFFLRYVSDYGDPSGVSGEMLERYAGENLPSLIRLTEGLLKEGPVGAVLGEAEEEMIRQWAEAMNCSAYMKNELYRYVYYGKLSGITVNEIGEALELVKRLPVQDKEEGKGILHEIRQYILQ